MSLGTILVVDDSLVLRTSVVASLTKFGFQTVEAVDGLDGLKILRKMAGEIDLVLLDWFIPRCNDQEFLEMKQRDESILDIPVIMVTTANDPQRMVNAVRLGAKHYVIQPFTEPDLMKRIKQVLQLDEEIE